MTICSTKLFLYIYIYRWKCLHDSLSVKRRMDNKNKGKRCKGQLPPIFGRAALGPLVGSTVSG